MFSQLRFLLFENENRTFPCLSNTLSIAMRGKPERKLRASTRRLSDGFSHILGPETYANYRTSSKDPSSCMKPRLFRWMKAGCPRIFFRRHLALHDRELSGLRLSRAASERSSRQHWPKPEAGFPDRRGQPLSLESRHQLLRPESKP